MSKTTSTSFDEILAGRIFTSPELWSNFEILCDDMGCRFAGTPEEKEAARFLEGKLREYGLENVHAEEFEYNGWTRGKARLSVTSPLHRDLDCLSMPMSPPGRVHGQIVDLGAGAPEAFNASNLEGNVALVTNVNPTSEERWIQRTEKYNRAILAGAGAFIFVGNTEGVGPITGTLGFNRWGLIPGIMVSKEIGLFLRRLTRRNEQVEVEIETTDTQARKTSWNIIGDVKGSSDHMVVIGNHYDGHDLAQGAEDPTSGLVAALEIARVLPQLSGRLECTVRFVLFGVEELGLIGAHAYVDSHPRDIANTRIMFNLDSSGRNAPLGLMLYGPDTRAYFRDVCKDLNEDLFVDQETSPLREPEHLSADHYPFMAQGVPSCFLRDPENSLTRTFYHSAHDTVDKVRALDIKEAAFLCARLAWRVANEDRWPVKRPSQDEIAKMQSEYDKGEVVQIEKAVEALRRKWPQR